MKSGEVIRTILKEKNITQTEFAKIMGYASQGAVGNKLKQDSTTAVFAEMLDKLGYEVVVQPKTQGKRKDGAIVLEPSGIPDGRGKKKGGAKE